MLAHRLLLAVIYALIPTWLGTGVSPVRAENLSLPIPPTHLPRHANFVLDPAESSVELVLFTDSTESRMGGVIQLHLGDPSVAVIALEGMVGLSVDRADLVAMDFEPDLPGIHEPLRMIQDPRVRGIGSWNWLTGKISFELHLIAANSAAAPGNLPVPMPLRISGSLSQGVLKVDGNNGNVADGSMAVHVKAFETPMPPQVVDVWFSTSAGFHPGRVSSDATKPAYISDGDLLSARGYVVRTARQLMGKLGVMPPTPDLGLDAVLFVHGGETWFSFKASAGQVWSESLATWLTHGDLLSDAGKIVMTNADLLRRFDPAATRSNMNYGLDAVYRGPNRDIVFSTDEGFFSRALGRYVGHGDLLSLSGRVVRTNAELLKNFKIQNAVSAPTPQDYGLDAVVLRPFGEVWFSTTIGFMDERYGWVSDGDLLSSTGVVVARNLALVSAFQPTEHIANFGLDALTFPVPCLVGDFDYDGDVDADDLETFAGTMRGPALASEQPDIGDLDGDGDTDQTDFGILQRCISGADEPARPECGD
ncbi:MAG TPA: hypothetical protein PLV57_05535 [Phycisphaerae bacterium]|nr:hypothetical protein [Phycisphaerae bacterium]HPP25960.1 hypothetical protein [Phycisphaerae bacterium]